MSWPDERDLRAVAHRMARGIGPDRLGPGDLAALRRLDPAAPPRPFWMLWFAAWEDRPSEPPAGDRLVRDFAVYARTVAELGGHGETGIGEALAGLGEPAEARLLRLLRLHGERLEDELRQLARLLQSRELRPDPVDLALLLAYPPDHPRGEAVRRRIARDFYARLFQSEKETAG
jgi:hypothetical protein